jgi:sterol 3beta-glucosyltransferase
MKFALMTHGTRGDVQPLVALGAELVRRGHDVELALPDGAVELAHRAGLDAVGLPGDWQQFLASPETDKSWLFSGDNNVVLASMRDIMATHAADITKTLCAVGKGADVIVSGMLTEDIATVIAEAERTPLALVHMYPVRPTGAVANPLVTPMSSTVSAENWHTHVQYERANWRSRREGINRLRAAFGLEWTEESTPERASRLGAVEIQVYGTQLLPELHWPAQRPVVGWLELNAADRAAVGESGLDADLTEWLDAGDPPVYFGLGSMAVPDQAATVGMVERVMRELGLRAVISSGWAGLPADTVEDPDRVRVVGAVDHTALLPRCRLAVHHGGAGTTGATVRAGLPSMICSVMVDQAMWGEQLQRIGSGVHVRFADLDATSLRAGVERLLSRDVTERARELSRAMPAEQDATARAADIVIAQALLG